MNVEETLDLISVQHAPIKIRYRSASPAKEQLRLGNGAVFSMVPCVTLPTQDFKVIAETFTPKQFHFSKMS